MPGRDGTGPMGQGAMTGRGFGFCAAGNAFGYGAGLGLRFGCRRGFGRNLMPAPMKTKTQKELLTEQKELLENRLDIINKQLENL